ncbi:MAG TPA: hypothetical protein IAB59_02815, partial [Candidatus Onthousia faecipullorum]|nr:hypothetical protein [Candidatus Onthousia faecipullorum]
LKYNLNKNGTNSGASLLTSSIYNSNRVLDSGTIEGDSTNTYSLNLWITDEVDGNYSGQVFSGKLRVEVSQENVNKPNEPVLDDNMIAVSYNGTDWVKTNIDNNWYSYDNGKWANAVTVSETSRSTYLSAEVGTVVSMDDIETMWVWIPRYSYTIGSEDGTNYYGKQGDYLDSIPTQSLPGEIDTKFVSISTKDRGTAKYIVSSGIQSNSWYTPDAFTFGDEELSGIWVGKFETSSSNLSASYGGGNTTGLDTIIKSNVTSWRYINVRNIHTVATKVSASGNRYGFSESMNSHAMKKSEWAVVSYLSQSKYGKLGNRNFTGSNKEVYQNKSEQYITGCSYGSPGNGNTDYGCQYTYDIEINGTGASTTGNIYGVYDMSGGVLEYVMGNYNDMVGSSGFREPLTLESKYYDKYTNNNVSLACNGSECLSYGLSETVGWYNDYHNMVSEEYPWLVHGGFFNNNTGAGVFNFVAWFFGNADSNVSFRLVISPSR